MRVSLVNFAIATSDSAGERKSWNQAQPAPIRSLESKPITGVNQLKKSLKRTDDQGTWYFVNGEKISGVPPGLWGDVSYLWGNVSDLRGDLSGLRGEVSGLRGKVTDLWGDVTDLWGDLSGLRGDLSGLRGNVTGLRGNVDDCEITQAEREEGIDVSDLLE